MFFYKKDSSLALICDIGSATVGLALVDMASKVPKTLFVSRIPITILPSFDIKTLEPTMFSFFTEAVKNLETAFQNELASLKDKHIERVALVFSSPWYVAKTQEVVMEKEKPFVLDEHSLTGLVENEEKNFEKETITGGNQNVVDRNVKMIERELIRVRLNGYETSDPFLKKANHAELSLYMSLVPDKLLDKMVNLVRDRFHVRSLKAFTFPLISFNSIRTLFPHESEYVLIDIAGEMTDVSLIRKNVMCGSKCFSIGRNTVIRTIVDKFGVPPEIALSFITLYSNSALNGDMQLQMDSILKGALQDWYTKFQSTVSELETAKKDANKVFVSADNDINSIFVDQLKKADSTPKLQIFPLFGDALDQYVSYDKHVLHDPFLALETIFLANRKMK